MTTPRVAVITRTKNRPVLLKRALASVAAQTYTDYTLVVVNDAGDLAPVEQLIAQLPEEVRQRVVLVNNEVSGGREAAMNSGLNGADSELFVLHDDDDSWAPGFLAACVDFLDAHPDHLAVVTRTELVREEVQGDEVKILDRVPFATQLTQMSLLETMVVNYAPPISMLVRRAVINQIGFFDGSLPVLADWEFNLRLLQAGPVGFIDGDSLAFWHHRATTDADLGNSIVVDGANHHDYNVSIRDAYLRRDMQDYLRRWDEHQVAGLAEGAATAPGSGMGQYLMVAEFYRRLAEQLSRGAEQRQNHLDSVHASLVSAFLAQNEQIAALREEARALHGALADLRVHIDTPWYVKFGRLVRGKASGRGRGKSSNQAPAI